jgi:hypothetical protein
VAFVLHPGLALAGLALVSIPIIIHFLNRRRFRTVEWAAMEFLLQALRRNRRRMRFESWLLLLTRCLVIGLLGLALARPFGCADSAIAAVAGREAGLHVIILDDSASMAYRHERDDATTHFEHGRKLANAIISRLGDGGDQMVALVAASEPARGVIASPTYETSAAAEAARAMPQTWRATDLAGALDQAVEIAADAPNLPRTLHVITDDTASALADNQALAEAARRAAGQYRIVWHHLAAPGQSNQALLQVRPADALVRRGFDTNFFAIHQRFGGTPAETVLTWRLDGQSAGGSQPVTPSAEAQTVTASDPALQNALTDGRPHILEAALGAADGLPADDVHRRVVEQVRDLPVLLVEGGRSSGAFGSGEILSLALQPAEESGYISVTRISDLELAGRPLDGYRAIVLAGVGNVAEPNAQALADYVQAGGTLMLWLGEAVTADNYNAVMQSRGLLPGALVQRVNAPEDGLLGFDFDPANVHPYLEAFANRDRSGLDVGAILQYWKIDLADDRAADVVLRFLPATPGTAGDPAVTTHALGDGRVLFITTAAGDPEWTLLPLRDNYVAFVHELLNHAVGDTSGGGLAWQTLEAGRELRLPPTLELAESPVLASPSGQNIELRSEIRPDGAGSWVSKPLEEPGVYQLSAADRSWPIAVNLPTRESDLRPLTQQSVAAALGDIEFEWLGDELPSEIAAAPEDRPDFGWSLLLAVLLLAGMECFMAMRFGRHRR